MNSGLGGSQSSPSRIGDRFDALPVSDVGADFSFELRGCMSVASRGSSALGLDLNFLQREIGPARIRIHQRAHIHRHGRAMASSTWHNRRLIIRRDHLNRHVCTTAMSSHPPINDSGFFAS
jgi:hypothetical protein